MATGLVVTIVVDVGQGQCTFVTIYDDSTPPKLVHALLFDCGTDKRSPSTDNNIAAIAAGLATMAQPTLDLIVLSHSDNDHISLLAPLLEVYHTKYPTVPLTIKNVVYAGAWANYEKHDFNILDGLHEVFSCNFWTPPNDFSQFDKKTGKFNSPPMWQSDDGAVEVALIVGNVVSDEPGQSTKNSFGTNAEQKNRVSIICGVFVGTFGHILCGDATNVTMAWTNQCMGQEQFTGTLMLTLPHHGSRATGLAVPSSKDASKNAVQVVLDFAHRMLARTLTVSAFRKHHHPSAELIRLFVAYTAASPVLKDLRLQDNSHYAVCNVDIHLVLTTTVYVTEGYHTIGCQTNLFSTYYFENAATFAYQFGTSDLTAKAPAFVGQQAPAVNPHASWLYYTQPGGTTTVEGYTQLPATTPPFTTKGSIPAAAATAQKTIAAPNAPAPLVVPTAPPLRRSNRFAATSMARLRAFR